MSFYITIDGHLFEIPYEFWWQKENNAPCVQKTPSSYADSVASISYLLMFLHSLHCLMTSIRNSARGCGLPLARGRVRLD
eukprot:753225-Hanusia_phi.AAC.8